MPQMKSADSGPITDSASTDSSIFELETSKSKSNEACYSGPLSEATSSSSVMSSVSADGLPSDLIARGTSSSSSITQQSSSDLSLIPSLKELTMNEKLGANNLRSELQGFLCKVAGMEEQLLSLKKKLMHKQKYIGTLESNLKRIEGQNSSLKHEVSGLKKDNEDLRQRLFQSDTSGSLQALAATQQKKSDRILSPMSQEKEKPAVTAKELTTIKDRLFAAHKQIDILEKDFREEHEQRLTAERDLARMKAAVRDLERDCDTLRLQVQFLQEDFYREHEDKKVLERTIRMRENASNSTSAERNWQKNDRYPVQEHEFMGRYDRSPAFEPTPFRQPPQPKPRTFHHHHHHSQLTSDVECDSSTTREKKSHSDLQTK